MSSPDGSRDGGSASAGDRPWRGTISGRVDVTYLPRLGRRRAVRVYLPPDYESSGRTYPVLFMFDGHNLFDRSTSTYGQEWRVDETLEELHAQGRTPGIVVVGMDAPEDKFERYAEYTAWDWDYPGGPSITGCGEDTVDFVVRTVLPWANATYRVHHDRAHVAVAGSSMGGYMSIYLACRHPQLFATVLALSPVTLDHPMRGDRLRDLVADSPTDPPVRFYLDMGDNEHLEYVTDPGVLVAGLRDMADALRRAGHTTVVERVIAGGAHDEDAWAARFADVLLWGFHRQPLGGG